MSLSALTIAVHLAVSVAPAAVTDALQAAAPSRSRVVLVEYTPSAKEGCAIDHAEVTGALNSLARVAVHLSGHEASAAPCDGWAWVKVQVFAQTLVSKRALKAGDSVVAAVELQERLVTTGHEGVAALPNDAVATRAIPAGTALEARDFRGPGPSVGEAVTVLFTSGNLSIEQRGTVVPCAQGKMCARLASGKRVEGEFSLGRLMLETP